MITKNKYGQYMTPEHVAEFMCNLIEHRKECSCLEPSCGNGIFLSKLNELGYKNVLGIETDESIINPNLNIKNKSFITTDLPSKYDVIIGNPPYIRWKNLEKSLKQELQTSNLWNKYCNSFCDYSSIFIIKSIENLKPNGELIFITSDYWFSTTHAKQIRNYILENGYIKEIYHFNETRIFDKVNVSFVIFKFIKDKNKKPEISITKFYSKKKLTTKDLEEIKNKKSENASFFMIPQFNKDEKWIFIPNNEKNEIEKYETACKTNSFKDFCDIGNGMVSGLDNAFKLLDTTVLYEQEKNNTINVIKAKDLKSINFDKITKYIFIKDEINETTLKQDFFNFFEHFQKYKNKLQKRYNYNRDIKYWEWAFLRNFNLFKTPKERIFCPSKERITNKNRFRFSLVPQNCFPTQDVTALFKKENTKEDIRYITALLNSKYVFKWLCNKGIRKGDIIEFSEKPISSIPYRAINFQNKKEIELYNKIILMVDNYKKNADEKFLNTIDECFNILLKL